MKKFLRNNRGGAAVEFSLVVLPVLLFIFGIMQTGWIVWTGNLLQSSVDAAARCGGVGSTTVPCYGPTTANMIQTANEVFRPMSGATFAANGSGCASGTGLVGTYTVTFIFVVNMTVTAKSCYPVLS